MRATRRRLAAFVAVLVVALAATAYALERPPALPPQAGCELWRGTVSGNDPSVLAELRICPNGEALTGRLQWSSTTSGYSIRGVEGTRHGTRVALHDTHFVQYRPAPGWRFCLVDRYELDQSGDALTGTYVSDDCTDHARVTLRRVQGAH